MISNEEFGYGWTSPQQASLQARPPSGMQNSQTGQAHPVTPDYEEPLAWRKGADTSLARQTAWRPHGLVAGSAATKSSLIMGGIGGSE